MERIEHPTQQGQNPHFFQVLMKQKPDYLWSTEAKLNNVILSDQNGVKLEINNRR